MFKLGIITASDKGATGQREDESGALIKKMFEGYDYELIQYKILPDDRSLISQALIDYTDKDEIDIIITTGGTGFSPRDWTPEATEDVIHRRVPGIAEAMRAHSLTITPKAMFGRGIAGIRHRTLIVNLPGSPKAVREHLTYLLPHLKHALDVLIGQGSECGQK